MASISEMMSAMPRSGATCVFENTKRGSVTIKEDSVPDEPQDFECGLWGGIFGGSGCNTNWLGAVLDDDPASGTPNSITFPDYPPGELRYCQGNVPAGWNLTGITCDDSDWPSFGEDTIAFVHVDPGEHVTCTFTNTRT